MEKNAAISAMILAKVAGGMDVIDAMREVLGVANVDAMIDDLYHSLRAK